MFPCSGDENDEHFSLSDHEDVNDLKDICASTPKVKKIV